MKELEVSRDPAVDYTSSLRGATQTVQMSVSTTLMLWGLDAVPTSAWHVLEINCVQAILIPGLFLARISSFHLLANGGGRKEGTVTSRTSHYG